MIMKKERITRDANINAEKGPGARENGDEIESGDGPVVTPT